MKKIFSISGVRIALELFKDYTLDPKAALFADDTGMSDISVRFVRRNCIRHPECAATGRDDHFIYYRVADRIICEKLNGRLTPSAVFTVDDAFSDACCALSEYAEKLDFTASILLNFIPLRLILNAFGAVLLHASQVRYQGGSLLFTGPSGCGKTTQATLWRDFAGADIISGDRSAVKRSDDGLLSFGYLNDGSSKITRPDATPLKALIALDKSPENRIVRLGETDAFKFLLPQTSIVYWDDMLLSSASAVISDIVSTVPFYRLACRPDNTSVDAALDRLLADWVYSV